MKKKLVFGVTLVCMLTLSLVLTGCNTDSDDNGGGSGISLPANLQNTTWKNTDGDTLNFKVKQIELTQYNGTTVRTFNVVSGVENGKIEAAEVYGNYIDKTEEFCSSYSIAGTTLTLKGDRSFSGTYTKQ
jgi:hypothetical protein